MTSAPVFIEVENFRDVLDDVDVIKGKLLATKQLLHDLHDLRTQENKELFTVEQGIDEMEQRLRMMDEELYEE